MNFALINDFDRVLSLSLVDAARLEKKAKAESAAASANAEFAVICLSDMPDGEEKASIEALILERAEAKKAKNFARADEIRSTLAEMGVEIKDVKGGVEWKK